MIEALIQQEELYIIQGIDSNGLDHVLAVCRCYDDAKQYCISCLSCHGYLDVWIEKHLVQ